MSKQTLSADGMGFYGASLAPNKALKVTPPEGRVLRIGSASLDGRKGDKNARATLLVASDGAEYVVCNLTAVSPSATLDLFFVPEKEITFTAAGNAEVHLTGYTTMMAADDLDSDDEGEEIDEERLQSIMAEMANRHDDSEDESEEEKSPAVKPKQAAKAKQAPAPKAKAKPAPKQAAAAAPAESDEDSESEEEDAQMMALAGQFTGDSDEDSDGSEGSQGSEGSDSEDELPTPAKAKPAATPKAAPGKKRKGEAKTPASPAAAPRTQKKQKTETPKKETAKKEAKTPAKTPAKPGKAAASPAGKVVCSDASCKRTFPTEAAMQQHAKAKHGKK